MAQSSINAQIKHLALVVSLMGLGVTAGTVSAKASTVEGQKIFKKKFRRSCRFSGVRFARYHTQMEWQSIYTEGKLSEEAKALCPRLNVDTIDSDEWFRVYEFIYEYASDSGHVPSC
jgi:hypothetical protein